MSLRPLRKLHPDCSLRIAAWGFPLRCFTFDGLLTTTCHEIIFLLRGIALCRRLASADFCCSRYNGATPANDLRDYLG
jgi:hypothetical protein